MHLGAKTSQGKGAFACLSTKRPFNVFIHLEGQSGDGHLACIRKAGRTARDGEPARAPSQSVTLSLFPHSISLFTKGDEGGREEGAAYAFLSFPSLPLTTSKADKQTWFLELASQGRLSDGH